MRNMILASRTNGGLMVSSVPVMMNADAAESMVQSWKLFLNVAEEAQKSMTMMKLVHPVRFVGFNGMNNAGAAKTRRSMKLPLRMSIEKAWTKFKFDSSLRKTTNRRQ